jgi:hypothetical protein
MESGERTRERENERKERKERIYIHMSVVYFPKRMTFGGVILMDIG